MKKFALFFVGLLFLGAGCEPAPVVVSAPPTNTAVAASKPTPTPTTGNAKIFFVALNDNGASGKKIGCDDSIVGVNKAISSPTTDPLADALNALFEAKDQYYGQSGLYNSLTASDLEIKRISSVNGAYTVELSGTVGLGGSCDSPRVYSQIMETVQQFSAVKTASVLINNKKIEDALSTK